MSEAVDLADADFLVFFGHVFNSQPALVVKTGAQVLRVLQTFVIARVRHKVFLLVVDQVEQFAEASAPLVFHLVSQSGLNKLHSVRPVFQHRVGTYAILFLSLYVHA